MTNKKSDRRLIEAGFPCHQVGAETQREQSVGLQPPTHRLHVWWARRPLTPSRAAVLASLLPAEYEPSLFVRQLGIERVVAEVAGQSWIVPEDLWHQISWAGTAGTLDLSAKVQRALLQENEQRANGAHQISGLQAKYPELSESQTLTRWRNDSVQLDISNLDFLTSINVCRQMADPAWANERIAFEKELKIRTGDEKYNYKRAYSVRKIPLVSGKTVLDPTAGGGSIPFESLRLGCDVVANDLNPVASVILRATLDYPRTFGLTLKDDISRWGERLSTAVRGRISHLFPASKIPRGELSFDPAILDSRGIASDQFLEERLDGYIFVRQVTCPHCRGEAPLFNAFSLLRNR